VAIANALQLDAARA